MNQNVGTTERAIRVVIAIALVSIVLLVPVSYYLKLALYVAAAVALLTAAAGICPLWSIFGVNTCARR